MVDGVRVTVATYAAAIWLESERVQLFAGSTNEHFLDTIGITIGLTYVPSTNISLRMYVISDPMNMRLVQIMNDESTITFEAGSLSTNIIQIRGLPPNDNDDIRSDGQYHAIIAMTVINGDAIISSVVLPSIIVDVHDAYRMPLMWRPAGVYGSSMVALENYQGDDQLWLNASRIVVGINPNNVWARSNNDSLVVDITMRDQPIHDVTVTLCAMYNQSFAANCSRTAIIPMIPYNEKILNGARDVAIAMIVNSSLTSQSTAITIDMRIEDDEIPGFVVYEPYGHLSVTPLHDIQSSHYLIIPTGPLASTVTVSIVVILSSGAPSQVLNVTWASEDLDPVKMIDVKALLNSTFATATGMASYVYPYQRRYLSALRGSFTLVGSDENSALSNATNDQSIEVNPSCCLVVTLHF
jgi:hypothetical protein